MKQDWHPDELAQHWTLSPDERELLGNKSGATRLNFAILLKTFQFHGRFPDRREDVAGSVVAHLASQTGVPPGVVLRGGLERADATPPAGADSRALRFPRFPAEDEPAFIAWLSERVTSPDPEAEAFKIAAYGHLRAQHLEPPATERLRRLLRLAVGQREERLVSGNSRATLASDPPWRWMRW